MEPVPFHIGIATPDLGTSMQALTEALGLTWTAPTAGPGLLHTVDGIPQPRPTSCVSRQGPVHLDLVQGEPGTIWAADEPHLHHFAYWTDDLAHDVVRLTRQGWRLEMTRLGADGQPTQFAYLVRGDGFRVELIDEAGRADFAARLKDEKPL